MPHFYNPETSENLCFIQIVCGLHLSTIDDRESEHQIKSANQLTGFYMMGTLVLKGLIPQSLHGLFLLLIIQEV